MTGNPRFNEEKFKEYAVLARDTALGAAAYQSPKLAAVAVGVDANNPLQFKDLSLDQIRQRIAVELRKAWSDPEFRGDSRSARLRIAAEIRKHERNRDGDLKSSDGALALRLALFLGKLVPSLLNKALGTGSSDFPNACMFQIQAAAPSPFGTISETAMNAALAMIAAATPKDEIEGALTVRDTRG